MTEEGEALLVGEEWLQMAQGRIERIGALAANGCPVILSGQSAYALSSNNTGMSSAFSNLAGIYSIYHNRGNNAIYCYSESGGNLKESIESAFEWINNQRLISTRERNSSYPPAVFSITKTHGNFGDLIVNTQYERIEFDQHYLVMTHYNLTGDANTSGSFWDNWTAVADLRMSCQHVNSSIADCDPHVGPTVNGTQTVNLYHYDAEYYEGWSYNDRRCDISRPFELEYRIVLTMVRHK